MKCRNPANVRQLFPLDGCRGFGGDVVDDAVDAADLVDDLVGDVPQEVIGEGEPVGGHAVGRNDGPQRDRILVGPFVAHDAHALDRQQDDPGLPDGVVQVRRHDPRVGSGREAHAGAVVGPQAADKDVVGLAQHAEFFFRDVADDADRQGRTRERMAANQFFLDAEGAADPADLIFEEHPQRLDDFEVHLLRQTAHVVVRLDLRGKALDARGFDDVRVDRALGQPAGVFNRPGMLVESLDEEAADELALGLGIGNPGERGKELLRGVGADDIETHVFIGFEHILELILAQQAVADEDTGQVVADGLVEEHACDRGIHAAAQAEDDLVVPESFPQFRHRGFDERSRRPVSLAAADAEGEIGQHLRAFRRVKDLRMELDRVGRLSGDLVGRVGDIGGRSDDLGAFRKPGNRVSVGHPHLRMRRDILHQGRIRTDDIQHRAAVFAGDGTLDIAAVFPGEVLGAVADAQERNLPLDAAQVHLRGVCVTHGAGTAGKDDPLDALVEGRNLVVRENFAEDVELSQPSADELGYLGTRVEDDDPFSHDNRFEDAKIRQKVYIVGENPYFCEILFG